MGYAEKIEVKILNKGLLSRRFYFKDDKI